jgi:hypothetical protein
MRCSFLPETNLPLGGCKDGPRKRQFQALLEGSGFELVEVWTKEEAETVASGSLLEEVLRKEA